MNRARRVRDDGAIGASRLAQRRDQVERPGHRLDPALELLEDELVELGDQLAARAPARRGAGRASAPRCCGRGPDQLVLVLERELAPARRRTGRPRPASTTDSVSSSSPSLSKITAAGASGIGGSAVRNLRRAAGGGGEQERRPRRRATRASPGILAIAALAARSRAGRSPGRRPSPVRLDDPLVLPDGEGRASASARGSAGPARARPGRGRRSRPGAGRRAGSSCGRAATPTSTSAIVLPRRPGGIVIRRIGASSSLIPSSVTARSQHLGRPGAAIDGGLLDGRARADSYMNPAWPASAPSSPPAAPRRRRSSGSALADRLGYDAAYTTHIAGRDSLTVLMAYAAGQRADPARHRRRADLLPHAGDDGADRGDDRRVLGRADGARARRLAPGHGRELARRRRSTSR